ncbi:TPA: hypothetical protein HA246_01005 [Candidatus Woesearchaeota archaeon]|nr:hypothetical protein [Candidatus Woesearchaeota archaeon]
MTNEKPEVVFLDVDETLGEQRTHDGNVCPELNFYPGVDVFLSRERDVSRLLWVATTRTQAGKPALSSIEHLLCGYLGNEQLNSYSYNGKIYDLGGGVFVRVDGRQKTQFDKEMVGPTTEVYGPDVDLKSLKNYTNPNHADGFPKDFVLARRLISPIGHQNLRAIMVGDAGDWGNDSDPSIPVIVVSDSIRKHQRWDLVSVVLDSLFSDKERMPWEIYDSLRQDNAISHNPNHPRGDATKVMLNGIKYTFIVGRQMQRGVFCPEPYEL